MNIKKFLHSRAAETLKLLLIFILFFTMLFLFYRFTEVKMRSIGGFGLRGSQEFPAEKLWIFTGDSYRASLAEAESPYIFPTSVAFRSNSETFAASGQKSIVINIYNDFTTYISDILGPMYSAQKVGYDEYIAAIKNDTDYTLISYDNDIPSYILRIYCDRTANGFYKGESCYIKKILLVAGDDQKLCAYTVDSGNNVMYFSPMEEYNEETPEHNVTGAVIRAYTENKTLVKAQMTFESDYFSDPSCAVASDIVLTPGMQFYETGIINPLGFITSLSQDEDIMKNEKILSILESFEINTGLVRHYTDNNVISFVDRNAALELSSEGFITYSGENGGIHLSRILNNSSEDFSFADKLTAAITLMSNLSRDIVSGNGDLLLTAFDYNSDDDILSFEFTYTFDSVPFHGLEKIKLDIGKNSILKAYIPTYNFYRNSTRKISLIDPEISYSITGIPDGVFVEDYKPGYVLSSKGNTAGVAWIAVTNQTAQAD